jgi:DNA-binding MarR family transcriptional regulator
MDTQTAATAVMAQPREPADLMQVVGRLRRTVRRRARRDWGYRPLPESELELLRLVDEQPGLRVLDAAAALGVAPNTVSTLVGRLAAQGLLRRQPDPRDARAARLEVTDAARERFAAWRDRRRALVAEATARLGEDDRRAIEACVPALRRLVELLEDA